MNTEAVIATLALIVAVGSFYYQWIRVRGAKLVHFNVRTAQRALLMAYQQLPESIRSDFPQYSDRHDGNLFVKIVFANTGDRTGLCDIKNVSVSFPSEADSSKQEEDRVQASYYSYVTVGPYEVRTHPLLLRNVPRSADGKRLRVEMTIDYIWINPHRRVVDDSALNQKSTIYVDIEAAPDDSGRPRGSAFSPMALQSGAPEVLPATSTREDDVPAAVQPRIRSRQ